MMRCCSLIGLSGSAVPCSIGRPHFLIVQRHAYKSPPLPRAHIKLETQGEDKLLFINEIIGLGKACGNAAVWRAPCLPNKGQGKN